MSSERLATQFSVDVGDHVAAALRGIDEPLSVLAVAPSGEERAIGSISPVPAGSMALVDIEVDAESRVRNFDMRGSRELATSERNMALSFGISPDGTLDIEI